ncbi:tyrosine-type recombinase/integrase [candidate division KSB1 bacterium]|nr:tyrosine-type recombinase/integrase [candidate division KSB1 bacterium]
MYLDKITIADIERFKVHRLQVVCPTTVNIDLRTCRATFYVAKQWGLLTNNPLTNVQQLKIARLDPVCLTGTDQITLLEGICEAWLCELALFALNTGMRRGEVINLRWVDVDMDQRMIRVPDQEHFTIKDDKGRVIPMNDPVYGILHNRFSIGGYFFTN